MAGLRLDHIESRVQSGAALAHLPQELCLTKSYSCNWTSVCHLNHETDCRHADHIVEKGAQVFVNHCNAGTTVAGHKTS